MSTVNALSGFRRSRKRGGQVNNMATNRYPVKNNSSPAIFTGDPVMLSAGFVRMANSSTDRILGIASGFTYVDNTTKQPVFSKHLPASTNSADGLIFALVDDDVDGTFILQANASLTSKDLGLNFTLRYGGGNTFTGRSSVGIIPSTRTASTQTNHGKATVKVVGLYDVPGNAWGDAFTKVECRILLNDTYSSLSGEAI